MNGAPKLWCVVWSLSQGLLWCGEGWAGLFDDGWWGAGVGALAECGGGEEFGVAVGAVAGAEEVEEALLGDGDGGRRGQMRGSLHSPCDSLCSLRVRSR
jgi:hypothetical protein